MIWFIQAVEKDSEFTAILRQKELTLNQPPGVDLTPGILNIKKNFVN
jgi:hypothetical protein